MTLDETIKTFEKAADEQEKLCKSNDSFNFSQPKWKECLNEYRQITEWLKDYKRLLDAEKNWRTFLESEIAAKEERINSLKAELSKPLSLCEFTKYISN